MSGLVVVSPSGLEPSSTYPLVTCRVQGDVEVRSFHPDGMSIWCAVTTALAPAELTWAEVHGDEVVYLLNGEMTVEGATFDAGTALIVEANVAATMQLGSGARIAHFGPAASDPPGNGPLGPAETAGHGIHVVQQSEVRRLEVATGRATFYADSTCSTCRVALLRNSLAADCRASSHSHSQDELMLLLAGDMQFGTTLVAPGDIVAIPADHRYGFRTGAGCEFLNYRPDAALMTLKPGKPPTLETYEAASRDLQELRDELVER